MAKKGDGAKKMAFGKKGGSGNFTKKSTGFSGGVKMKKMASLATPAPMGKC